MLEEQRPADSHRLISLAGKMHDKRYRDGYVASHTRQVLAKQMRDFRGALPQTEFAELIDKRQTMVSRLENPNYSGWTLGTLLEVASKLNVAVFVRFVDFPTFLKYSGDLSESALHPARYDQQQLDDFARAEADRETFSIESPEDILFPYEYCGAGASIPVQIGHGAVISGALVPVTPGVNMLSVYGSTSYPKWPLTTWRNLPPYAGPNLHRVIAEKDAEIAYWKDRSQRAENALLARTPVTQKSQSSTQEFILPKNAIARGILELPNQYT